MTILFIERKKKKKKKSQVQIPFLFKYTMTDKRIKITKSTNEYN